VGPEVESEFQFDGDWAFCDGGWDFHCKWNHSGKSNLSEVIDFGSLPIRCSCEIPSLCDFSAFAPLDGS